MLGLGPLVGLLQHFNSTSIITCHINICMQNHNTKSLSWCLPILCVSGDLSLVGYTLVGYSQAEMEKDGDVGDAVCANFFQLC